MEDIAVIENADVAAMLIDPLRGRILQALSQPGSASSVAATLALPRQQVNYHVRALEAAGLVHLVEQRARRGLTERVLRASAKAFVVSPELLGGNAPDPARVDRLSSAYHLAVAARMLTEVGQLIKGAARWQQSLATLTLDTEIRFASPAQRAAFAEDLTAALHHLVAKYHDERASDGRWQRVVAVAHPMVHASSLAQPEQEPQR